MIDAATPEAVAHIGLIDVATLRAAHGYGAGVAGLAPGVAGQNGRVAGGGETSPPGLTREPAAPCLEGWRGGGSAHLETARKARVVTTGAP